MLLSTAYFPNIQYFTKLASSSEWWLEAHESYQRQTWRNRCVINGANGKIVLTVPVVKGRSHGLPIRDARIDYETPWQRIHLRSIESAYQHSPFYEFYIDEFMFVFLSKEEFLFDLNHKILLKIIDVLGSQHIKRPNLTIHYESSPGIDDWRSRIHPKEDYRDDKDFSPLVYSQVFEEKNGFQANLSIIDALFQLGPETRSYLTGSTI